MYSRKEFLESTDCAEQSLARENKGLDWNYAIARRLDRDLHEKLLAFTAEQMLPFAQILPLVSSGYFDTARSLVESATVGDELSETKEWLLGALAEADDTKESEG